MIAVVAFANTMASAELLKNFKADGSVEALGMVVNNSDFDSKVGDKYGDVKNRVMINAGFDLNQDVDAVVSVVKCDRSYGQVPQTAQNLLNVFTFEQAYLNLKNVFGINHKIGRQYYGNDGDIVIYYGPNNWYTRGLLATPVALDGWTANWSKNKLELGAIMAKLSDLVNVANSDTDLYGITASYDLSNEYVKPAAYVYEQKDRSVATNKLNNLEVIGVKATGAFKGVNYKGEYAMNMGNNSNLAANSDNKYQGSAIKLNADYGYDFMGKVVFMAEVAMGSGDKTAGNSADKGFQDINANYRPGIITGGLGVVNNLNNLTTWNLGANWTPEKENRLNLEAKYYDFSNTQKDAIGAGGVTRMGGEANLVATWNHSQNVALKLGLGAFMPTKKYSTLVSTGKTDAQTMGNLYMNIKF
jgi:hypothetical protein